MNQTRRKDERVRYTLAIPTWNRSHLLKQTLHGLQRLQIPDGVTWEVIVCDNNSTDDTRRVAESMSDDLPFRYLFEERQGKGFALKRIIEEATGQWIAFLDDDVLVDPDLIATYYRATLRYPEVAVLGGQVLPWVDQQIAGGANKYLIDTFPWVHGVMRFDADAPLEPEGAMPHGPATAIRRDCLLEPEAINPSLGMFAGQRINGIDTDLARFPLRQGHQGWFLADAKVSHYIPPERTGIKWFCKWHIGQGRRRCVIEGPAQPGRCGFTWLRRLIAKRLLQALVRYRPRNPRTFYEYLAEASRLYGYLEASSTVSR